MKVPFASITTAALWLLAGCATWHPAPLPLPPEAPINQGAGRGDLLYLTLRLGGEAELLFAVDTGCPVTVLDKSLEPRLGQRLGTKKLRFAFYGAKSAGAYAAPPLYLGDTRLATGARVYTDDLSSIEPGRPFMGILGMDCLDNYCVQLDFANGKLRFLDPDKASQRDWGGAFPLTTAFFWPFYSGRCIRGDFFGARATGFVVDTGRGEADGVLTPRLFRRALRQHRAVLSGGTARFSNCECCGTAYTNLVVMMYKGLFPRENLIGLEFLARHCVTFNFPDHKVYFKFGGLRPEPPPRWRLPDFTCGWWETPDRPGTNDPTAWLARQLLRAPNLSPKGLAAPIGWSLHQPESKWLKIPAGPPLARLSVGILPPCDYRFRASSSVRHGSHGEAYLALEGLGRPKHGHTAPLPQRGTVLLLHDYNSQMEFMSLWAFELAQAGYRVVLVDLRGHGASTGQEVSYGKWETEDLKTVLDRLTRDRLCDAKVGVLGVGYGATLALQFAARDARVATVVAIAPYHRFEQACQRLAAQEAVPVPPQRLHGALEAAAAHLGINWDDWSAEAALRGLKTPVLLIGGGKDPIATGDDLKALERLSPAGSRSLVIPEADHWFIAYWLHDLSKPVEAWVGQHLP